MEAGLDDDATAMSFKDMLTFRRRTPVQIAPSPCLRCSAVSLSPQPALHLARALE